MVGFKTRGLCFLYCVTIVFAIVRLSNATTEPLPELEAHEKHTLLANLNDSEKEEQLLDVDAGGAHESTSNREVRQFGFRRGGFGRGGFGRGGYGRTFGFGGFRPYGFYRPPFYGGYYRPPFYGGYRPPYYGGFYRPPAFYRPPPFFYRPPPFYPYYGFRPGFYG